MSSFSLHKPLSFVMFITSYRWWTREYYSAWWEDNGRGDAEAL